MPRRSCMLVDHVQRLRETHGLKRSIQYARPLVGSQELGGIQRRAGNKTLFIRLHLQHGSERVESNLFLTRKKYRISLPHRPSNK
jgi:hypothetical protein